MKLHDITKKFNKMSIAFKGSLVFFFISIIDKAISILTQPFLNRILTVDEVGVYGVFTSWYSLATVFFTFNLFGGIFEVLLTKEKEEYKDISASLSTLSLFITLLFSAVVLPFSGSISLLLNLKSEYLFLMILLIVGDSMIQFWAVEKRYNNVFKTYAFVFVPLIILKALLSVLLCHFFSNDRILGRILGLCIPSVVFGIIFYIINLTKCNKANIFKYWKKALLFNIPLIPHYISSILLASSDKIMLDYFLDTYDVGLYTLAYSFSSLALIVFGALNSAYNPFSMKCIKNKDYEKLGNVSKIIVFFSICFSLVLIYLAPEGIFILGGDKFKDCLGIVPILVLGIFFSSFYFIFSNVEFVYEKNKLIFPITLIGALLNIGLNFLLIPIWGYEAAAYTTLIGYFFIAVSHYIVSYKILKTDVFQIKYIVIYLLIFLALTGLSIYLYRINSIFRYIVLSLIIIGMVLYIKKNFKYIKQVIKE